ncbi:MAG: hypothetical protein LBI28_04005 [Treponema sp.]|nr:hypothetical protein [Treponema sp.]
MSTFLKPLVALGITILIFAGFFILVDTELLDLVQTRFYNPSVVNTYVKENSIDAEIIQNCIFELQDKFAETLTESAVRSSFLYNQSAGDIYERSRIYGILSETIVGLQSIQFVDTNGLRIHYSTSARDIMSQDVSSTAYRNYNEDPLALPYDMVSVADGDSAKFFMDEQNDRIIYSYPFKDSMDVYRGTALFTVSAKALLERLAEHGRLKISDNVSLVNNPVGILLGSPETSKSAIIKNVSEVWNEGVQGRITLDAKDSGVVFSLISLKTERGIYFGRLINDVLFSISTPMKLILNISIFFTFYLTLFFVINAKPNPVTVVRNRMRRLRESLFDQLYVNKSAEERVSWILELEQRRDGIHSQLKGSLKFKKQQEESINRIIDDLWDELLAVLKVGSGLVMPLSFDASAVKPVADEVSVSGEAEELEEIIEEAEAIEEAGAVDEIEEIGEVDEIYETGEIEEVEEIAEIEEIEEPVEVIDEISAEKEPEDNVIDIALSEAMEPPKSKTKGLLERADKLEKKPPKSSKSKKGLLSVASNKAKIEMPAAMSGKGLLALADESLTTDVSADTDTSAHEGGLLASASKYANMDIRVSPGLLDFTDEMESTREYLDDDNDIQDVTLEVNVVSPFQSMFSSLEKTKKTRKTKKK